MVGHPYEMIKGKTNININPSIQNNQKKH